MTDRWPADAVERRLIAALVPSARNARLHSDAQVAQIAASMGEWGWTNPILVNERGEIIAGHGRVLAAQKLGWTEAPVMVARGWSEAQERAYALADNKLALNATWDEELLSFELKALREMDVSLDLLGFDQHEVDKLLLPNSGRADPDDAPAVEATVISKPGDLWLLGRHRLLCGSATSQADHDRVIGASKIDAVVTDPPYGVGVKYSGFDDTRENVEALIQGFVPLVRRWPVVAMTPGHTLLWDYPRPTWLLAWVHPAGMGNGPWGFTMLHPILVYGADPYLKARAGGRPDTLVLATDRETNKGHPVIKPVAAWQWLIERVTTKPGTAVLDCFCGSGTTIIAAEMTGRSCIALEIAGQYCDVSVRRWQDFTGQEARLDGDGRSFADVEADRTREAQQGKPAVAAA